MGIGSSLYKLIRRRTPSGSARKTWDAAQISDTWFRGHFEYAADAIQSWLTPEIKLNESRMLDFGCGDGITALGVALKAQPADLVGVDITRDFESIEELSKSQLGLSGPPSNLRFHQITAGEPLRFSKIDVIYSWSVFEHIDRKHLPGILANFRRVLRPGGLVFIQIEPLYLSAFGSHLQRLVPEPWAHLHLSPEALEERAMSFGGELGDADRDLAASEGVTPDFKQWLFGEYQSLNRLEAAELGELFRASGFEILREQRSQRPEQPPPELLEQFTEEELKTNEIRLLARNPG